MPANYAEIASTDKDQRESLAVTTQKVLDLCNNHLNCHVTEEDISVTHRIPNKGNTAAPSAFVRFVRRSVRDQVFKARFQLKALNQDKDIKERIFINEHLTTHSAEIFSATWKHRKSVGVDGVWTAGGRVMMKRYGTVHHVESLEGLRQLMRT